MGEYEDKLDELREAGLDEQADFFEGLSASALRQKAKRSDELAAEVETLKVENQRLKSGPVLEKAFRDAGVDFEKLKPAEKRAISSIEEEPTEELVSKTIAELELPLIPGGTQQSSDAPPNAAGVVEASRMAPQNQASSSEFSAAEVNDLPTDQLIEFGKRFPEQWEALKQGAEKVVIAGSFP